MQHARQPHTLAHSVTVQGHGLHSNRPCKVILHPMEHASGIHFLHSPSKVMIPARADRVGDLSLATTLEQDGVKIGTVEHLLSALAGLQIEHALIEVDSLELPILDGSASMWVKALQDAGSRSLPGHRRVIKATKTIEVVSGKKWMRISPHPSLRIRCMVDYPHPAIGRQSREMTMDPDKYVRELASARTFCMEQDIEMMRSMGLALGGSLENAVVFAEAGPLNDALRFEDEVVRHKMLDLVGDLALLGAPLAGLVEANEAGHALHVAMVKALLADTSTWRWADAVETRHSQAPVFSPSHQARPLSA